uniref:F-box domain-containing protein n=1 Tax=Ditylenchus dipsaci TaxID=166011 RepID=A0A915CNK3_9BILA
MLSVLVFAESRVGRKSANPWQEIISSVRNRVFSFSLIIQKKLVAEPMFFESCDNYLLIKIFEFLPCLDRLAIEQVCHRWYFLGKNHSWSKFTMFDALQLYNGSRNEQVHRLALKFIEDNHGENEPRFYIPLTRLRTGRAHRNPQQAPQFTETQRGQCRPRRLNLTVYCKQISKLKWLAFANFGDYQHDGLASLLAGCNHLEYLRILPPERIYRQPSVHMIHLPNLDGIKLPNCLHSLVIDQYSASLGYSLDNCASLFGKLNRQCHQLQSLHCPMCLLRDPWLTADISGIFSRLAYLSIDEIKGSEDEVCLLPLIPSLSKNLQSAKLSFSRLDAAPTFKILSSLVEHCGPNLRCLDLTADNYKDRAAEAVFERVANLPQLFSMSIHVGERGNRDTDPQILHFFKTVSAGGKLKVCINLQSFEQL